MNYLAIFVCGIAAMIVGFIWYGPLFGKVQMEIMGAETMSPERKAAMKKNMWWMYLLQFILALITARFLGYLIMHSTTSPVALSVWVWFGFLVPVIGGAALWSGKPCKTAWKMFLLSAGAQLVTFIVFGFILGMWK